MSDEIRTCGQPMQPCYHRQLQLVISCFTYEADDSVYFSPQLFSVVTELGRTT